MTASRVARIGLLVAVLGVGAYLATRPLGAGNDQAGAGFYAIGPAREGLLPGDRVPELRADYAGQAWEVTSPDGAVIGMSDLAGRPRWVIFGATWCTPCREQAPAIRQLAAVHAADGLAVVLVYVSETAESVRAYAAAEGFNTDNVLAGLDRSGAVAARFGVWGYPTQYWVDADGTVVDRYLGPLDTPDLADRVERLLVD